jgi:photosystem II stability/assembly factor-like uncharacterized protein
LGNNKKEDVCIRPYTLKSVEEEIKDKKGGCMYKTLTIIWLFLMSVSILFAQSIKSDPIYAIAISPQNPDIIYAGSKGVVYIVERDNLFSYTPSKKEVWLRFIPDAEIGDFLSLAADPTNAKRAFAVTKLTSKLYNSTSVVLTTSDGGKNWDKVSIPEVMKYTFLNHKVGNYGPIAIDPLNPKIISVGAEGRATMLGEGPFDLACLILSTDGGDKWNISVIPRIGTRYPKPINSILSTSKSLFFSTPDGIFRFRNDVKKYGFLEGSPKNVTKLVVDPSNQDRILAITQDGKIYETINNGDSFALLVETNKKINCLTIDSKEPKTLWIGTDNGVFKSTDNGTTWNEMGKGQIKSKMVYSLAINPANNQLMYCGTNQGLFVSEDQGITWQIYKTSAEKKAEKLLSQAESLELRKEYDKAIILYKQILDSFPTVELTKVAEQKYKELKIANARKQIALVSEEKVRSAIDRLGLSVEESNALFSAITNISRRSMIEIIINGLEMPLDEDSACQEYQKMTPFQKFYAILCYKDYRDRIIKEASERGEEVEMDVSVELLDLLPGVSLETIKKLCKISPKNLIIK